MLSTNYTSTIKSLKGHIGVIRWLVGWLIIWLNCLWCKVCGANCTHCFLLNTVKFTCSQLHMQMFQKFFFYVAQFADARAGELCALGHKHMCLEPSYYLHCFSVVSCHVSSSVKKAPLLFKSAMSSRSFSSSSV